MLNTKPHSPTKSAVLKSLRTSAKLVHLALSANLYHSRKGFSSSGWPASQKSLKSLHGDRPHFCASYLKLTGYVSWQAYLSVRGSCWQMRSKLMVFAVRWTLAPLEARAGHLHLRFPDKLELDDSDSVGSLFLLDDAHAVLVPGVEFDLAVGDRRSLGVDRSVETFRFPSSSSSCFSSRTALAGRSLSQLRLWHSAIRRPVWEDPSRCRRLEPVGARRAETWR